MIASRPYQSAAVEAVFVRFATDNSTLVVLPTGTGKTVVFGLVAKEWPRGHSGRVLVLAHRDELITQAAAELAGILGQPPDIEQADRWAKSTISSLSDAPLCVVASVQSLCQPRRLERWPVDEFGLIITDEAHHATAESYRRIFAHFKDAKRLGVTATPKRADQIALGSVFGSVCYEMGICEAVDDGWLVPVEQRYVTVKDMDLAEVRTEGGDFAQGQLGAVLTGDSVLDQMVAATVELCGEEPTLIFTSPRAVDDVVSQGDLFADALNKIKPEKAVFLSGQTERDIRRRELDAFEQGHRQYLVGCSLFTEGFNVPKISRIVMARPTKSVGYYTQAIGRGTRTLKEVLNASHTTPEERQAAIAASLKPSVLVIDFVGNSGRHKLVSAVDIFAGKMNPDAVVRAKKKAEGQEKVSARTVQQLLAEAERELEQERQDKEDAERRRKERKGRVKVNSVNMHQETVNPFETSDAPGQRRKSSHGGKATVSQIKWIRDHGGYCVDTINADTAGRLIADIKDRWAKGLCSPKQEKTLRNRGFCSGPIPKHHANALISWLVARKWNMPREPLSRKQLAIISVPNGLTPGYQLTIDKHPVGGVFDSPAKVREVYRDLVREPAQVA